MTDAGRDSRHVVLVHGTWAQGAAWTKPKSLLRSAFERGLPGDVVFTRFQWSGRNTFRHRERAAAALAEELTRTLEAQPRTQLFVIGHSHGGNVALQACALLDKELRATVGGIVCISTPFLHSESRRLSKVLRGFLTALVVLYVPLFWLVPALTMLGIIAGLPLVVVKFVPPFVDGVWVAVVLGAWLIVGGWLALKIGLASWSGLVRIAPRRVALPMLTNLGLRGDQLLSLHTSRDEAMWSLVGVSLPVSVTALLVGTPLELIGRVTEAVRKPLEGPLVSRNARAWSLIAFAAALLSWVGSVKLDVAGLGLASALLAISAMLLLVCGVVLWWGGDGIADVLLFPCYLAIGVLSIPVVTLVSLLALPFGADGVLASLFVNVRVSPSPPGSWNTEKLRVAGRGLRHSRIYSSPEALSHIVQWLLSRPRPG